MQFWLPEHAVAVVARGNPRRPHSLFCLRPSLQHHPCTNTRLARTLAVPLSIDIIPCIISMHQRPHSPSSPASPLRLSGCSRIRPAKRLRIQLWLQQLLVMHDAPSRGYSLTPAHRKSIVMYLRAPRFLLTVAVHHYSPSCSIVNGLGSIPYRLAAHALTYT